MFLLLSPILKYLIGAALVVALLAGIYLKGRHDGTASLQRKIDAQIAQIEANHVIELQKQSEEKDKIIQELNLRASDRQEQIKTIIKTVKIPDSKECILDKDAINFLNSVR